MASKKLSSDTSLANSYKLSRGVASVARPSAPTIGTATDTGVGLMSVTFTASTLGPTASSYTLTSSSGITGSGASSPLTLAETAVGTYTYSVSGVNANGTGPSSAASNSVNVASIFAPSGAYDSIATTNGSSGGATFTSIPQTYTHLQLRIITKSQGAATDFYNWRLNGNATSGNYRTHTLLGTGASVSSYTNTTGNTSAFIPTENPGTNATNVFATIIIDILDYANTNKYTTMRTLAGWDANGTGQVSLSSGVWLNTSAITSIAIGGYNTDLSYSGNASYALYGIKGA